MKSFLFIIVIAFLAARAEAQQQTEGPARFRDEVTEIVSRPIANQSDITLFTGSSSIKMWTDISAYFRGYNIVNRGFGGSQTTDLLYYVEPIILSLSPARIFIYEGDNDLANGKSSQDILATSDSLLQKIRERIPARVPVYFISPKPSVARWELKEAYIEHTRNLKAWTGERENVHFVDGWTPLVDKNGIVRKDIFLQDNLHLNKKGYDLWSASIRKALPRK